MLILVETAAGYGLFKVKKGAMLEMDPEEIFTHFEKKEKLKKTVSLEAFSKFADTKEALKGAQALIDSSLDKGLRRFLKANVSDEPLGVADKSLAQVIKKKLDLEVVFNPNVNEIIRGIRTNLSDLLVGITDKEARQMALGLSHTLNRWKLKFSPEKVDTMIVQAIGLLDDLDRELNNFAMRLKEWYGWHFPELAKIVTENMAYAKAVKLIGMRTNTRDVDLSEVVSEEMVDEIRKAAEISMGTDITEEDVANIFELSDRVRDLSEYRASLGDYLKYRMQAIAPNLTFMVGELIGARLIARAGSLMGLAKQAASTVQVLGAEKALFRAMKTKSATPKYGLIYHAAIVGQCTPKLKGKVSRVLAAKLSLCARVDALGEQEEITVALDAKHYVDNKMADLQKRLASGMSTSHAKPNYEKYTPQRSSIKSAPTPYASHMAAVSSVKKEEENEPKVKRKHKSVDPSAAESETTEVPKKKKKKVKVESED